MPSSAIARTGRLAVLVLCLLLARAVGAAQSPLPDLVVSGWLGTAGNWTPQAVAGGQVPLEPLPAHALHKLGPGLELWLRLDVRHDAGMPPVLLVLPLPILDRVTLHQRTAAGWQSWSAGDRVPMGAWPVAGRYPTFPLELAGAGRTAVYLQVRHATPVTLPMRLEDAAEHHQRAQVEYLALGLGLGAVALLVVTCLVRAWWMRDRDYLLLALYAFLSLLGVAATTGVGAHLLWGDAGAWVDIAPGLLALVAAAGANFVTARLTAASIRSPWLGRSLHVLGWSALPMAAGYALVGRSVAVALLAVYFLLVACFTIAAAVATTRRGDVVGRWILCGGIPLAAGVFVTLARSLGWVEGSWWMDYALVAGFLLNLPMLLGALNSRSRDRRTAHLRQRAAADQDPLTGLPKAKVFFARVRQALARHAARGEPATIVLVEVANLAAIQQARGREAAEESLLRAVIKLRGLLRDVDTAGRIGEARLGIVLEGVASRARAGEFAQHLVAAGLIDEAGEGAAIELRFHVVLAVLADYAAPAEQLLREMVSMLGGMSPRTRRPVRFLSLHEQPAPAMPSDGLEREAKSSLPAETA